MPQTNPIKSTRRLLVAAGVVATVFAGLGVAPATAEEAESDVPGFERTGEFKTCVSATSIRRMKPLNEEQFYFRVGSRSYINDVNGSCNGAGRFSNYLLYSPDVGQLCRHEIIKVMSSDNFLVGTCSLGDFELLEKIPDDDE